MGMSGSATVQGALLSGRTRATASSAPLAPCAANVEGLQGHQKSHCQSGGEGTVQAREFGLVAEQSCEN